jgi:hypothetical protein
MEKLRKKVTSAYDGTGNQLRKKRDGENEVTQRLRRSQHAPINIEGVGK